LNHVCWPCVTDLVIYPPMGSMAKGRKMSTLSMFLQRGMAQFTLAAIGILIKLHANTITVTLPSLTVVWTVILLKICKQVSEIAFKLHAFVYNYSSVKPQEGAQTVVLLGTPLLADPVSKYVKMSRKKQPLSYYINCIICYDISVKLPYTKASASPRSTSHHTAAC